MQKLMNNYRDLRQTSNLVIALIVLAILLTIFTGCTPLPPKKVTEISVQKADTITDQKNPIRPVIWDLNDIQIPSGTVIDGNAYPDSLYTIVIRKSDGTQSIVNVPQYVWDVMQAGDLVK
jgi:hypothetical protein